MGDPLSEDLVRETPDSEEFRTIFTRLEALLSVPVDPTDWMQFVFTAPEVFLNRISPTAVPLDSVNSERPSGHLSASPLCRWQSFALCFRTGINIASRITKGPLRWVCETPAISKRLQDLHVIGASDGAMLRRAQPRIDYVLIGVNSREMDTKPCRRASMAKQSCVCLCTTIPAIAFAALCS